MMRTSQWLTFSLVWLGCVAYGQSGRTVSGKISDEHGHPLAGAIVSISGGEKALQTDSEGYFSLSLSGRLPVEISFLGYETFRDTLDPENPGLTEIRLKPSFIALEGVVVKDRYRDTRRKEDARNIEIVSRQDLSALFSGSLMQSLEKLPGIGALEIGSGQSKPIIRGLGFNRVAVIENGIKHEGQPWGEEHGLEIDQYTIDRIEIIKGPASLMYGSDAIGGVIDLKQLSLPEEHSAGGSVDLSGKSNNRLLGTSGRFYLRNKRTYLTARITLSDYADYRVPTDSISIYSYKAPLYRNQLRNTAGRDQNFHLSAGYSGEKFNSRFFLSNLYTHAGFFANAHGLEPRRVNTGLHDASDRDIHYPRQEVNHLKLVNRTSYLAGPHKLEVESGWQRNFRREWSPYVSHGFMPAVFPENLDFPKDLELQFDKSVYSVNLKDQVMISGKLDLSGGISTEYQRNLIGGRGFIIPAFDQFTSGIYFYGKYPVGERIFLHGGLRYDYGRIRTEAYHDWFPSPVETPGSPVPVSETLLRAPALTRHFSNISWAAGLNYNAPRFLFKANVGKSFRMPIAKELASHGVNYHHFSYEIGDPDLPAEVSYQLDLGAEWQFDRFSVGISPFVNYFPHYIYLNPTSRHDYLYGAGNQVFYYTGSRVFRTGGELFANYRISASLKTGFTAEYVYSEQLSGEKKGFSLPFSPPASGIFNLEYSFRSGKVFRESRISADLRMTSPQNRIVPPEMKTPGYEVLNLSASTEWHGEKFKMQIRLKIENLLNRKYFNHTGYYRIINVPEPGRNLILEINLPFGGPLRKTR